MESCFYCKMVRDRLKALGLEYEKIEVPSWRGDREAVYEVSGQYLVPVLVDNDLILDDEDKILKYLEETYGRPS
ncbi:MAG: glutathione S-transferase N-terminal domain-containing protein [Nitrospiria bacterium]